MCCGNRGESDDDDGPISPNRIESRSRRREANLGSSSAAAGNGAIQIHAWPNPIHARTHDLFDRARLLRSILGGETAPPFSPLIGMWRKGRRGEGPYRAIASSAPHHQSIRPLAHSPHFAKHKLPPSLSIVAISNRVSATPKREQERMRGRRREGMSCLPPYLNPLTLSMPPCE